MASIVTSDRSGLTFGKARLGGESLSAVGLTITGKGVCWSTSANPTIADAHTDEGTADASFASIASPLLPNTTYHYRAYLTTMIEGTVYGADKTLTTPADTSNLQANRYLPTEIGSDLDGGGNAASPTNNSGVSTTVLMGLSGATLRRFFARVPTTSADGDGDHLLLKLRATAVGASNAGKTFSIFLLSRDPSTLVEGSGNAAATNDGLTWNAYAYSAGSPLAWTVAPVSRTSTNVHPGHDCDTTYVSYPLPTATGTYCYDISALKARAIALGFTTAFAIMICTDAETTASVTMTIGTKENATSTNRPVLTSEPYVTMLECEPIRGLVGIDGYDVSLQLGSVIWGASDEVTIEYGTAAHFAAGTGFSTATPVNLNGKIAGELVTFAISSSTATHFREKFTVSSIVYPGDVHAGVFLNKTASDSGTIILLGDDHTNEAINTVAAITNHPAEALQVQAHTMQKARDLLAASGFDLCFSMGDTGGFTASTTLNMFPALTDGSGLAATNASSKYGLTITDSKEALRYYHKHHRFPWSRRSTIEIKGNHAPAWSFFYSAHNGAVSSAANDIHAELQNYRRIPASGSSRIYTGQSNGEWFWFEHGPILFCVLNPFFNSITSTDPLPSPLPTTLGAYTDWTLGSDQYNDFFDPDTGVIPNNDLPFVVFLLHNLPGGRQAGPPVNYGRSDPNYVKVGYWLDIHNLIASLLPGKSLVILGHDHQWESGLVDGVQYVWIGTPGQAVPAAPSTGGAYSNGFTLSGAIHTGANVRQNAGYAKLDFTPTLLTLKWISSFLTTSPVAYSQSDSRMLPDGTTGATVTVGATTSVSVRDTNDNAIKSTVFTVSDDNTGVELVPAIAGKRIAVLSGNVSADSATEFQLLSNATPQHYGLAAAVPDEGYEHNPAWNWKTAEGEALKLKCNGVVRGELQFAYL